MDSPQPFVRVHWRGVDGTARCGLFAWHGTSDDPNKVNCARCLATAPQAAFVTGVA